MLNGIFSENLNENQKFLEFSRKIRYLIDTKLLTSIGTFLRGRGVKNYANKGFAELSCSNIHTPKVEKATLTEERIPAPRRKRV